jgi:hypothetical protein
VTIQTFGQTSAETMGLQEGVAYVGNNCPQQTQQRLKDGRGPPAHEGK